MARLTDAERETHIRYSQDSPTGVIVTAIRKDITELQKKGYRLLSVDHEFYRFECPKKAISFRTVGGTQVKPKRTLSPEHKRKLREARDGRKESTKDNQ